MNRRLILSLLCVSLIGTQLWGAETPNSAVSGSPDTNAPANANSDDLKQLRERIAQQEEQIKRLQKAVNEQRALLERSLQNSSATQASGTKSTPDGTPVVTSSANSTSAPVQLVPAVNVAHPKIAAASRAGQHPETTPSPLSISIGNTTFTPLGFVDFTLYGRSTNLGSGIGTNFGSIPYNNSATGHVSETNFSTQNSRVGFRVDSTVFGAKVLGYFEADFLGTPPANVFVSSNSDAFRMRNVFVDVQKNGFEILGGQDWSLFTPNRKGLSPLPSDIFYTQDMDTNYQAGLVWARQSQFRVIAHPTEDIAFGVSLENPQLYVGGSSGGSTITPPSAFSSLISSSSGPATSSEVNNGNTTVSAANLHPDIIFKAAYDGHVGDKLMHIEGGALIRTFKFAAGVGTPVKYNTYSATAAAGEINGNFEIAKNFHLIANTFFGSGNGRYVFGQAPDFIIHADGSISPIHTYSTVDGVEVNVAKNTLLYGYYGAIYIKRDVAIDTNGKFIGYGYPGAPNSQNRSIQEPTIGIIQTFWKNPNYGALSLITQYSYLTRDPWYLAVGAPRNAKTNMYWVDLRYTLP
jgi:hypothetical protein